MVEVKVKRQEVRHIEGRLYEIWARYTTKAEAQAERKKVAPRVRHSRVLKDTKGYGVWVDVLIGTAGDYMRRGGTLTTVMENGRERKYWH